MLLDRRTITGALDERTPRVVLVQVAQCHGIQCRLDQIGSPSSVTRLLEAIRQTPCSSVDVGKMRGSRWAAAARYINPHAKFNKEQIVSALRHLENCAQLHTLPRDASFGPITPDQLTSLDECVVYRLLVRRGIEVPSEIDSDAMQRMLLLADLPPDSLMQALMIRMYRISHSNLVRTLACLVGQHHESVRPPSREQLTRVAREMAATLPDPRFTPHNAVEAVLMASYRHRIDLLSAVDPLSQYEAVVLVGREGYLHTARQFGDNGIILTLETDPDSLDLDLVFDMRLPEEAYSRGALEWLIELHGLSGQTTHYNLLHAHAMQPNFHHGKQLTRRFESTPFLGEEVSDLPVEEVVSYGVRTTQALSQEGAPVAMTYSELVNYFEGATQMNNPCDSRRPPPLLDVLAVRRLRQLCEMTRPNENEETVRTRRELLGRIDLIELRNRSGNEAVIRLSEQYRNPELAPLIRDFLHKILELGMRFRGWEEGREWPVAEAVLEREREHRVWDRADDELDRVLEIDRGLRQLGLEILDLPLVIWRNGKYETSTTTYQGRTLRERFEIVKRKTSPNSCIRLSSNWVCASIHRYLKLLGLDPGFQVERLRSIA